MSTLKDRAVEDFGRNMVFGGEQRIKESQNLVEGKDFDFDYAKRYIEGEELTRRYEAAIAKRLGIEGYEELRSIVDEATAEADVDGWIGKAAEKLAKLKSIGV